MRKRVRQPRSRTDESSLRGNFRHCEGARGLLRGGVKNRAVRVCRAGALRRWRPAPTASIQLVEATPSAACDRPWTEARNLPSVPAHARARAGASYPRRIERGTGFPRYPPRRRTTSAAAGGTSSSDLITNCAHSRPRVVDLGPKIM